MSLTQLGRYKITGTLGRGAMGVVYQALDPLIERTVAIKTVVSTGLSREETESFEQRFNREAKSAGRLNHPNIVTIHDVGRCDDLSYIAMEFLVGRTLRDILDSGVELSLRRIVGIAAQVADGLAFAHANDVVHRDIKPANIMVLDNDVVKIADFGVALLLCGSHTEAGTAFGSPKYMSPEQVNGDPIDGRSDVFSLGAVLYEMLAGLPPFSGADLNAILYQVLNTAPPLPSTYYPGLPHGFDRIVARAMAKNPDKRYQNVAEMAADLRKYWRIAKQAQKKQNDPSTVSAPPAASVSASDGIGDVTVPVDTESAPVAPATAEIAVSQTIKYPQATTVAGRYEPLLRFGAPLIVLALVAGWLLLRPAAPPQAAVPTSENAVAEAPRVVPPVSAEAANANPRASDDSVVDSAPPPLPAASADPVPAVAHAAPLVVAEGRIRLAIAPWGEIYVDGKKAGVSPPLTEIRLPAGKHKIEIRNGDFAVQRQNVDLAPDASFRIKHKFE